MDRISELPEPILQLILCFLSQKSAGQTCVLSKPWRYLWCTRPKIEFREKEYDLTSQRKREAFLSAIERNLQGIHDQKLCIEKFTLDIYVDDDDTVLFLKKWIPRFKLVKKFHLSLWGIEKLSVIELPPLVFDFDSIEEIYLHRCTFNQQQLHFSRLRRLSLKWVLLSPDLFSSCSTSFPCLEELTLDYCCYGTNEFNLVSCRSMKHLVIANFKRPFKATIDAPSIVSFCYKGTLPRSVSFAPTTSSNHWKSKISLFHFYKDFTSSYFNELNGLLKALSRSEISMELEESLIHQSSTNTVGVSDANLPVVVEQMVVNEACTFVKISSALFLNNLFRVCRPRFIHMNLSATNLHKVAEMLLEKERDYFWRHDLEGVICMKDVYCEGASKHGSFVLQWKGMST